MRGGIRRGAGGHTLIELTLAIGILTIGLFTVICSMQSSGTLIADNREYAIAYHAIRLKIEQLRSWYRISGNTFNGATGIYSHYKAGATESTFSVAGLQSLVPGANQGSVIFPTGPTAPTAGGLYENYTGVYYRDMGTPLDLDNDGAIDNKDVSLTYLLLPVTVQISWKGASGETRTVAVSTLIVNK